MRYSILHISDLHRIKEENIDCILSSFAIEKDYYARNGIPPAKLIVVSGDIVNGSNNEDSMLAKNEIQEQYRVASKFLKGLCELFIGKSEEDLLHVIIVPGNHDMSRYYSKLSMKQIPSNDINALVNALWEENNNIRWSWKDLKFYKIAKEKFYNKRFDDFIEFYNNFYSGKRIYPTDLKDQSSLFDYPELNLSVACFNSCYHLDHLRFSGYINPHSLSSITRDLLNRKQNGRLIVAVWHHHTQGLPNENNYLNYSILDNMVQNGISIALHGHQHISGIINEYKDVFSESKLTLISAGTLYGNSTDLPIGQTRQYNLLSVNIDSNVANIKLYSREDQSSLNEMPAWSAGTIGRSTYKEYYFKVDLEKTNGVTKEDKLQKAINKINLETESTSDFDKAIKDYVSLGLDSPIVRKMVLGTLQRIKDDKRIIQYFSSPQNLEEAISVVASCAALKDIEDFIRVLNSEFVKSSTDVSLKAIIEDTKIQLKIK